MISKRVLSSLVQSIRFSSSAETQVLKTWHHFEANKGIHKLLYHRLFKGESRLKSTALGSPVCPKRWVSRLPCPWDARCFLVPPDHCCSIRKLLYHSRACFLINYLNFQIFTENWQICIQRHTVRFSFLGWLLMKIQIPCAASMNLSMLGLQYFLLFRW